MPILGRLRYALYMFIVVTMIVTLVLSVAQGVDLDPSDLSVGRLVLSPFYCLPVYVFCFALAPNLAQRFPVSGDSLASGSRAERSSGYIGRSIALLAVALLLTALANVAVYVIGRLS